MEDLKHKHTFEFLTSAKHKIFWKTQRYFEECREPNS